ncbi:hypothetical protein [Vibrio metoecus]|uniref:hypothetical protein n=1 Tax=Vibrio metoecus TaxID=1481663 RepID=UPI001302A7F3|nr:hypothetical protein [Vibrio metoecus]
MANLNEEPVWEEGIYQFETTDPVEGGPEGIDNKPTRQLANRTAYLKQEQEKLKDKFDAEKTPNPLPQYMRFGDEASYFASIPIGMEVAFDTPPPTDDPRFRFVELTADSQYNGSLLINKVISGTAPNLVVQMTIDSPLSPINGQQIFMLNTMGATTTPSLTAGVVVQDAIRKITGKIAHSFGRAGFGADSGALYHENTFSGERVSPVVTGANDLIIFDSSRVVPTADRVEVFAITEVRYKRIF